MNFQMLGIHNLLMEQKIKGMAPEQGNQGQLVVTGNQETMIIASGKFRPLLGLSHVCSTNCTGEIYCLTPWPPRYEN